MIIFILAENKDLKNRFKSFFGQLGYSVIQYTHPLKAMDNLDEISPDILICSATDYPRHWKLIVKQIRDNRKKEDAVVVLSVCDDFDSEEADKAAFLGINFLFPERLETVDDFRDLDTRISRYKTTIEHSRNSSWVPGNDDRVSFIFRHPHDFHMITGRFTELSPAGGVFRPDDPGDIGALDAGTVIEGGSMRAGESLLSLKARIIRNAGTLSLAFIEFADDGFMSLIDEMSLHVAII